MRCAAFGIADDVRSPSGPRPDGLSHVVAIPRCQDDLSEFRNPGRQRAAVRPCFHLLERAIATKAPQA
jgi:hypothetical protein